MCRPVVPPGGWLICLLTSELDQVDYGPSHGTIDALHLEDGSSHLSDELAGTWSSSFRNTRTFPPCTFRNVNDQSAGCRTKLDEHHAGSPDRRNVVNVNRLVGKDDAHHLRCRHVMRMGVGSGGPPLQCPAHLVGGHRLDVLDPGLGEPAQ